LYTARIPVPVDQVLVLAGDRPVLTAKMLEGFPERSVQGEAKYRGWPRRSLM